MKIKLLQLEVIQEGHLLDSIKRYLAIHEN